MRKGCAALLCLLLAGCSCDEDPGAGAVNDGAPSPGPDGSTGGPCIDGLESIALSPPSATVTIDGTTAETVTFSAAGTFAGGRSEPIDPARLTWSATRDDQTPPGTIAAGVFTPNPASGGVVTIEATDGCAIGRATVTSFLRVVLDPPADETPWDVAPSAGDAPSIVYPSDETRFPRNIHRTLFQWRTGAAAEFRLIFEGPGGRIVIYTGGAHALCAGASPRAGCWEADETAWSYIAGSHPGQTISWTVEGLDRSVSPPALLRGAPITLGFSRQDVPGAIFYWSTTSKGIRRANIRAAEPEDYLTGDPRTTYAGGEGIECVACHVVSRSGKYLASPTKAGSGEGLFVFEVALAPPPPILVKDIEETRGHGFATISPDDSRMVAAWRGRMWMVDRATGDALGDLDLGGLDGTHPDWSPANDRLVFATGSGDAPGGASIAIAPFDPSSSTFGAPSILVPAEGDRTNLFPMFSPDGEWIAYSRGKGGHGDDQAQLFLAGSSSASIELVRANRIVSNGTTDGQHQNSQPTWAPPGDLAWIAFNSQREYGVVRGEGTQQIWVAAIDLTEARAGRDPSFPAFRLPFQGLDENNHRAFWTLDVRDPPDAGVADAGDLDAGDSDATPDPPFDGGACVELGNPCDPVSDVCCSPAYCDTNDDGVTYLCVPNI